MGVLNRPGPGHAGESRTPINYEVVDDVEDLIEWDTVDVLHDNDTPTSSEPAPRTRRQRTPILEKKTFAPEKKQKMGVRKKKRYENLCFLFSLVDNLGLNELEDEDVVDNHMSAFAELLIDPDKMEVWNNFVKLSEQEQNCYLDDNSNIVSKETKQKKGGSLPSNGTPKLEGQDASFFKIDKKIRDYLRSKDMATELLEYHECDIISKFVDDPLTLLRLEIPEGYERMIIHGLCQYMLLCASTHECNKQKFMEIENTMNPFQAPKPLLSQYLITVR